MTEEGKRNLPVKPQAWGSHSKEQELGVSAELRTFLESTDSEMRKLTEEVRKEIPNLDLEQLDARIDVIEQVMKMLSQVEFYYRPTVEKDKDMWEAMKEMYLNLGMIISTGGIVMTQPNATSKLIALIGSSASVLLTIKMFARTMAPDATRAFLRKRNLATLLRELKQARAAKNKGTMMTKS